MDIGDRGGCRDGFCIDRERSGRGRGHLRARVSLLIAKRDLRLESELRKLDKYDAVIIDDIGYIQQEREEMEVLFTFLGERYERRSVMISSNLVFSQWDKIFKDSMTTAAAIDRVVHHSTILELTAKKSYRAEQAKKQNDNTNDSKPRGKRK